MTTAISRSKPRAAEASISGVEDAAVDLRIEVHDASRIEWTVTVPLPREQDRRYAIDLKLEIPANVFARHTAWDQLQSWARLDGPVGVAQASDGVTIDALRRATMAFAHQLGRAHDGFARHCVLAGAPTANAPLDDLIDKLDLWLGAALETTSEARAQLVDEAPGDTAPLQRERRLVDEYLSIRLLDALASNERSLTALASSRQGGRHATTIAAVEAQLTEALAAEIAYRQDRGYARAEPLSPSTLEHYLERASLLKKHFQEVFFLEAHTYKVAERIHHWVAAFVAIFASTWAFVWQITVMNRPSTGSKVSSASFWSPRWAASSTRARIASRRWGAPGSAATSTASTRSASRRGALRRGGWAAT